MVLGCLDPRQMCGLVPHHDNLFLKIVFKLQKLSFKKAVKVMLKFGSQFLGACWKGGGGRHHVWKEQEDTRPSLLDSKTRALEICVFSLVVLQERGEKEGDGFTG